VWVRTSLIGVVAFVLLAAVGSWREAGSTWSSVAKQRVLYRGLTPLERQNASSAAVADPRVLDFWSEHVHRGDRYYLNLLPATPGFDVGWPQVVGEIAGYFLTPATQVANPARATVVLSWDEDPARVEVPLASSVPLPGTEVSVSRVKP
jgi:hypothetical protein